MNRRNGKLINKSYVQRVSSTDNCHNRKQQIQTPKEKEKKIKEIPNSCFIKCLQHND